MSEPSNEHMEFEHAGLECMVAKTNVGHWCGYVVTPDGLNDVRWQSQLDQKTGEIMDADVDVWGGITYGPDDEGRVGFDDGLARSLRKRKWPGAESDKYAVKVETMKLAEQISALGTTE